MMQSDKQLSTTGFWIGLLFAFAGTFIVWWWTGDKWERDIASFVAYMEKHRVGEYENYMLTRSYAGRQEEVALFFGYQDNLNACRKFVSAYEELNAGSAYFCISSN